MAADPRRLLAVALFAVAVAGCAYPRSQDQSGADDLGGTSWQLVKFEGGDGAVLRPDDRSKYTLAFNRDGSVSARIDCNRGRGTWKSDAHGRLELGPMALTRAACPPDSLHDHIVKQLPFIRSYIKKDGRLFLSLMADGGIYEFEPGP